MIKSANYFHRDYQNMFGLGWPEMGIIAIVAILVFGPKKIPELGSTIGKTLRNFKEGIQEVDKDPIDDTEKKSD